jgi:hypothetical protein
MSSPRQDIQQGVTEILQAAAAATGNGSVADMRGCDELNVDVTGTFVGTVTFEANIDGANWVAIGLKTIADGAAVTTATAAGMFKAPIDAFPIQQFRARVSAWTSGAITVKSRKGRIGA